jgi:hypothetical protein
LWRERVCYVRRRFLWQQWQNGRRRSKRGSNLISEWLISEWFWLRVISFPETDGRENIAVAGGHRRADAKKRENERNQRDFHANKRYRSLFTRKMGHDNLFFWTPLYNFHTDLTLLSANPLQAVEQNFNSFCKIPW